MAHIWIHMFVCMYCIKQFTIFYKNMERKYSFSRIKIEWYIHSSNRKRNWKSASFGEKCSNHIYIRCKIEFPRRYIENGISKPINEKNQTEKNYHHDIEHFIFRWAVIFWCRGYQPSPSFDNWPVKQEQKRGWTQNTHTKEYI